jgi:hypothetical protein
MPKLNPPNERIKRDYARHLKAAQGIRRFFDRELGLRKRQ